MTIPMGGTARVALRQLAPKPYSIERVETLPSLERFLKATGDAEIAWLTDGVDTGRGTEFTESLGKTIGDRTLTIFEGGASSPLARASVKARCPPTCAVAPARPVKGAIAETTCWERFPLDRPAMGSP